MSVMDALKQIPDESVDCVVSSPPYYGLRDYSGVATYASEDYDELLRIANTDIQKHRDRVLESQKEKYYLTEPVFNKKDKKWHVSLKYDISGVWGGNPDCEHEWISQQNHKDNLRFRDPNHIASVGNNKNPEKYSNPDIINNFCSKCSAWKGQLGLEPTYQLYVEHCMLVMKELKRVLKKTGTLFWNMGDSYAGNMGSRAGWQDSKYSESREEGIAHGEAVFLNADYGNIQQKSLMMIPERFAMAMIDDGWILRNKIVWYKRNGMPSSVRDRFNNKWEYVFFFTKSQKYYFDLDSIRKPLADSSIKRISQENIPNQFKSGKSAEFAETNPVNNIPKILNNMHQKYQNEGSYKGSHSGYFNEDGSLRANQNGVNPGDILLDNTVEEPRHPKGDPAIHGMRLPPQPNQKGAFNPNDANPGDVIYNSKYGESDEKTSQYSQRISAIEDARKQSYIDAEKLYPDDVQKQKEYVKNIHDHNGHPDGPNPGDVMEPTTVKFFRQKGQGGNFDYGGINSENGSHYNPDGANPGDVNQDEILYDLFMDIDIQDAFIEYLKQERPELLMPSILDIPTMSHSFAHFAVFPETLVDPLIKAGCSPDVCVKCGKPKMMEYRKEEVVESRETISQGNTVDGLVNRRRFKWVPIEFKPSCNCNAGFEPGTVLDPFTGSGTIGVVAQRLGRSSILIEISPEYCNIIKKRLNWGAGLDVEYGEFPKEVPK
jgi:DNA modification methylase